MTLHPQAAAALEQWAQAPAVHTLDAAGVRAQRAAGRELGLAEPKEEVAAVGDVDAGGVPCRLLRPAGAAADEPLPVLVYLHGGGFVFGDLDTHEAQSRRLANRTGRAVLAVDYRRPPAHVFPAALVDCVTALDWLVEHGAGHALDVRRTGVAGDSAGANLALGTALRRPGLLDAAVLVYPFLDPGAGFASYASTQGGLNREDALWFWEQYLDADPGARAATGADGAADRTRRDPEVAPLRSTRLGELPPTLVQLASEDTLVDEGRELVVRARDLGAEVTELTYDGMVHGFWRHPALFDAAEQALADAARWLQDR